MNDGNVCSWPPKLTRVHDIKPTDMLPLMRIFSGSKCVVAGAYPAPHNGVRVTFTEGGATWFTGADRVYVSRLLEAIP